MRYYIQSDSDGNQIAFLETESVIVGDGYTQISEAEYNQYISELRANLPESDPITSPDDILDTLIDDEQESGENPDGLVNALIGEE